MDAVNAADRDLRELNALADLLLHVRTTDLAEDTAPTIGEMLDAIAERLQASVEALAGGAP